MTALNKKLVRDLWRMRGQVLAIAAVIGGGIATLVMALSALHSLEETRRAYYEHYRFADVFAQAKRAPRLLLREIAAVPGVARVEGRVVQDLVLDIAGMNEPVRGRMISREATGETDINEVVIRRGRDLVAGATDEILVHEAFAEAHGLRLGDVIHGNINERRRALRVVGIVLSPEYVYAIGPGQIVPDSRRFGVMWMARDALEAAMNLEGAFNNVVVRITRDAAEAEVIARLDSLLERYGGTGAFGRADQTSNAFLDSELDQLANLATVMPPIFLAVAAFLLNIVLARLIQTEREQIGLLKAFGYSDGAVGWHYLKLVFAITAVGIAIGWAGGAWMGSAVTNLYTDFFRFPALGYRPDTADFAIGALVGVAVATLGTLAAVRRAVSLAPAVAMSPPPPTSYRIDPAERLGLSRLLSQSGRMIVRHILRWPLRAAFTMLGIALSVAILVSTLFFIDSVNAMMDIYFHDQERQDATVIFTELRADSVRTNLDDLPGVLAVEPFRSVSARLRVGHRQERIAIRGIEPNAELNRLTDVDRNVVHLPPEGLVLSEKLAELLGAHVGDLVTVTALEGRRLVAEIPVVRVVAQYIGIAAYMDRIALNRLMREGALVSGANLIVDRTQETAFYAKLKETPALLSLSLRRATFEAFREMIEQHLFTMIAFYVGFASMIAIGVVYNSARISLSERGRELASLRVLGFTRHEVGAILAGELAVLTFFALPLGCVIGYGLAALMVTLFDTELYRTPLLIEESTYAFAVLAVTVASAISAWIVVRRVANLDLVAVLKTRE